MPYLGVAFFLAAVRYIFVSIGVGFATVTGLNLVMSLGVTAMKNYILQGSGDLLGILGLMQVDIFINVIVSAYAIRLALTALTVFRAR